MHRPLFLARVAGALTTAVLAPTAFAAAADQYPSRPITLIVPWGAGGGSDQVGRAVAKLMQDQLKTTSVPVINVPGADGNTGMVKLVTSDADGYTLAVFVSDTFYGNMTSKAAAPWQMQQIVPLAVMNSQPFTYFANANSPYKTWADVQKAAQATPLKLAIDGFGSTEDIMRSYLTTKGLKLTGVPFAQPGERYAALLGNQVDLLCEPDGNVRRYIEGKQIRPVLVFSEKRVSQMPDAPTATEMGYKIVLGEWRTIVVKAGTDPSQVRFLADLLERVYKSPGFQDFLTSSWSQRDSYVPYSKMSAFIQAQQQQMTALFASVPK